MICACRLEIREAVRNFSKSLRPGGKERPELKSGGQTLIIEKSSKITASYGAQRLVYDRDPKHEFSPFLLLRQTLRQLG